MDYPNAIDVERLLAGPHGARLAAVLLASKSDEEGPFVDRALAETRAVLGGGDVVLARLAQGECRAVAGDASRRWPRALVSAALDVEGPAEDDGWRAVPLAGSGAAGEVLLAAGAVSTETLRQIAAVLRFALAAFRSRQADRRRTEHLQTLLALAQEWGSTLEMEPLLVHMAEASTQMLAAERASVFLWDKPNRQLVGRPALGVEGGELRIPDDTGVVGQVVATGEPRRVDAHEGHQINRKVDQQLKFLTRNLLCVPLRGKGGDIVGAFEVLNRREGNFTNDDEAALAELASLASIALENTRQMEDLLATHRQWVSDAAASAQLIGGSPAIEALRSTVNRVANTELAVLILGENGTGKEVVSRLIHYLSRRRDQPCIAVNCAALTETLLESELFGHEKGAFTDAHEARAGKFELASGGTLFLDEIGDLSPGGQAKLLRVLEEKIVVRVGGSTAIHTDARVLAATNQNLVELVREKQFREDLYFRLNVVTLELPPLRERGDDILLLAEHFLSQFCRDAGRKMPKLATSARKRLLAHPWPGNIRELRNLMERLAYLLPEDRIEADDLSFILSPEDGNPLSVTAGQHLAEATRQFQTQYIETTIQHARGNMSEAADRLGLHRSNLYRKMRQLDISSRDE